MTTTSAGGPTSVTAYRITTKNEALVRDCISSAPIDLAAFARSLAVAYDERVTRSPEAEADLAVRCMEALSEVAFR